MANMSGVRAELVVSDPGDCPVAAASAEIEGAVTDVTWTETGDRVTEQFRTTEATPGAAIEAGRDCERVFEYGSQAVYELERERTDPCFCERVEAAAGPVTDVRAEDGRLRVTLHAAEPEDLRAAVGELTDAYDDVRLEYLVRERADAEDAELVPVDLRQLTDRQREVLATAREMGYFEYPREANAAEVATALGISAPTFTEHLNAAQSKLLAELLS